MSDADLMVERIVWRQLEADEQIDRKKRPDDITGWR